MLSSSSRNLVTCMSVRRSRRPQFFAATTTANTDSPQRRFRSASAKGVEKRPRPAEGNFVPVYVHHVSKLALEHLQKHRSDWVLDKGLDRRLHINPNGTFVMSFPSQKGHDAGKIWTSYDTVRKQHWLSVYRQKLTVRFLLKDHGKVMETKLHDSKRTENRISQAVDQMISAIEQNDAPAVKTSATTTQQQH